MKTKSTKNRMLTTFRLAVLLCFVFISSVSWAQTIAAWQFGTPASKGDEGAAPATYYNPHIVQPVLLRGNGVQPYALGRGFSSINWVLTYESQSTALSNGNYYEFTITSEAHHKTSISSIKARLRRSENGPTKYQWAYSVNNAYFVTIGSVGTLSSAVNEGQLITFSTASIAALQNIVLNEIPLVLRLCAWNAAEDTGTFAFGRTPINTSTNSLEVNGTVAPEPAQAKASTESVADVRSNTAIVYGKVTDAGYPRATHYGFCWSSTNTEPTIADRKVDFGISYSTESFMTTLDNLTPGTKYYFRTYAINETVPAYGRTLEFTTAAAGTPKNIAISFTGSGSSTTVDDVLVENLTTGQSKTISGSAILYLNPSGDSSTPTSIVDINGNSISKMNVYPNPASSTSTLSFGMAKQGDVILNICDISGKIVSNNAEKLSAGNYKFRLPALKSGIYFVNLIQNGENKTQKLVSINNSGTYSNEIQNFDKAEFVETEDRPQKVGAAAAAVEGMIFNEGNQLRFTATSGRSKTILMDSPTKNKVIDVRFIECIDGDNNAYPVIKIGKLYWMAENLKTTKKVNGTSLAKVAGADWTNLSSTSDAYCYYGDLDTNGEKFGALYTHHAANTDLAPLGGWRLPTKKEFITMAGYLEGKERAGAKMKDAGVENWTADNKFATNESGFRAVASGMKVGTAFSTVGTTAAYWNATETIATNEASFVKLTSAIDSISLYGDTLKAAGLSVRYVFEVPDERPQEMEDVFGKKPTEDVVGEKGLPLPANTVLMAPDKELFFTGRHDTNLSPQLRFMDNPTATSAPYIAGLPTIASGAVKWWENPKKVTTMVNGNGRENTVIAVWNEAEAGAISGYKNITLHIISDESANYAHQSIVLPDKFWMPAIVSGATYSGQTINEFDIQECWQWEMTVRTGDITGDGVPEILVAVHDTLRIYEYNGSTITRKYQRGFYSDFSQSKNFAFYLRTEVADMNQDGRNDVVVMTSTPKSFESTTTDDSKSTRLHLFLNGNIQIDDEAVYKSTKLGNSFNSREVEYARTANMAVGDVNNDGAPEIAILYAWGAVGTRGLTYSTLDWTVTNNNPFKFARAEAMGTYADKSVIQPIVLARLNGPAGPNYIVNSDLISYVDESGVITYNFPPEGGDMKDYYFLTKANGFYHVIFGDQIVVGNFDKDPSGREMLYYIVNIKTTSTAPTTDNLKLYSSALNQTTGEVILNTNPVPFFNENSGNLLSKKHFPVIAAVNTKHTGRVLQYVRHEYTLTKPKLIVAMAAAPYYEGLYDTSLAPMTKWSKSEAAGTGKDTIGTHTATAIVGYEHEFELPLIGTKIGGIEFTAKAAFGFSKNYAGTETTTITVGYSGVKTDMAIVSSTPYDAFFYKILKSENPLEVNTEVMFGFPKKLRTECIPIDTYNKLIEGQNAPKIDKTVFRHTLGNPFSYPSASNPSSILLSNLPSSISAEYASGYIGVGQRSLSFASIGKESINSTTTGFSQSYDFELIGTIGGFKAGAGYGYNKERTETTTVGSGNQVEGSVPGMLTSSNNYMWALKWYNFQKSGYIFQVVNYLVK